MRTASWVLLACLATAACGTQPRAPHPTQTARRTLPPLDHERHGHHLHRLGDVVVCVGGFGDPSAPDRGARATWLLDLGAARPAWTRGPDLEAPKTFFGSAVVDGAIVAVGRGPIERWRPGDARWARVADGAGWPDTHLAAAGLDGVLYTVGGFPAEHATVRALDLSSRRSLDVPPLPDQEEGEHFHLTAVLDGALHVVGGLQGRAPKTSHWRLQGGTWIPRAAAPHGVWAKFAVHGVVDGRWYVFTEAGGLCYDPVADAWTSRARLPLPWLAMPGCLALDGHLLALGGQAPEGDARGVWIYDPRADAWQREAPRR